MDVASSKDLVVSARSSADSQSSLAASLGSRHSNTPHPQDPSRGTAHGRAGDRSRHRSRGRRGCPMAAYIRHAAAGVLLAFALLATPLLAQAHAVTRVGNIGQTGGSTVSAGNALERAQQFTTGGNAAGYSLAKVAGR